MTREVIGLQLDKSKLDEGQLVVDWTILEQDDGAVLQLLYYGDDQTLITVSATVEQQGDIREPGHGQGWIVWIFVIGVISYLSGIILTWIRESRYSQWLFLGGPILVIIGMIASFWAKTNPPVNVTGF